MMTLNAEMKMCYLRYGLQNLVILQELLENRIDTKPDMQWRCGSRCCVLRPKQQNSRKLESSRFSSDCKLSFGQKLLTTGLTSNWENIMINLLQRNLLYCANYLAIIIRAGILLQFCLASMVFCWMMILCVLFVHYALCIVQWIVHWGSQLVVCISSSSSEIKLFFRFGQGHSFWSSEGIMVYIESIWNLKFNQSESAWTDSRL